MICLGISAWFGGSLLRGASAGGAEYPDRPARTEPIPIPTYSKPLIDVSAEEWGAFKAHFVPRLKSKDGKLVTNPSLCIHSLRLHGVDAVFDDAELRNGREVLQALTDTGVGERIFGAQILARTRTGARYRPRAALPDQKTSADASHVDQTLASLLELGLPLSTPVRVDGADMTLRDVFADAVGNFNLREPEVEWSVVALALMLPPARAWRNRFGERFTFDDVVARLARSPFAHLSCGGTHVLYAMVILAAVNEKHSILSPDAEEILRSRLRELCGRILENQRKDGSWDEHWFRPMDDPIRRKKARSVVKSRLLITGHLGECLVRLPSAYRLSDEVLRRAGAWAWSKLPAHLRTASLRKEFCPLTHAALLVHHVRGD